MATTTISLEGWWAEAACLGHDVELFMPTSGSGKGDTDSIRQAKAVCAGCIVRRACLAEAERIGDAWTIRGGLTPTERGYDHKRRKRRV